MGVSCHCALSRDWGRACSPGTGARGASPAAQHSRALQAGRHSWHRDWQLQELTASSPAEADSVSLFILLFTFLVGCFESLPIENLNPQTQWFVHPSVPILGCVFPRLLFNIFKFSRGSGMSTACYTISYHVLRLTALISLMCERVWLDWYRSLAADLTCKFQIFKTLLLLTLLSLLTDLERKGNFALLMYFAVMGVSAPKLAPDCQCIRLVQHCAGIPALMLLREYLGAVLPGCSTAAAAKQAASVRAAPTLLLSVPVQSRGMLLPPGFANVSVCVCLPVYPNPSLNRVKSN